MITEPVPVSSQDTPKPPRSHLFARALSTAAGFGSKMAGKAVKAVFLSGTDGSGLSLPTERELLVSQATLRHIARRAVQVAILTAGILAVWLVFSRQAHAATVPSSPPLGAPATAATTAATAPSSAPAPAAAAPRAPPA